MGRVFWIKFYEDGVFCSAIGQPYGSIDEAMLALVTHAFNFRSLGFDVNSVDDHTLTYDRYGTLCTLKIEEAE